MSKKTGFLIAIILGIAIITGILLIRELFPSKVSVRELELNPSAWVNQKVVVQGKLVGPLGFVAVGSPPPWNYELFGLNETIETIGKPEVVKCGVLWNKGDYNFENTLIIGVIRRGVYFNAAWEEKICYYIEAQEIQKLD